jgi:hypothetical protein
VEGGVLVAEPAALVEGRPRAPLEVRQQAALEGAVLLPQYQLEAR